MGALHISWDISDIFVFAQLKRLIRLGWDVDEGSKISMRMIMQLDMSDSVCLDLLCPICPSLSLMT